MKFRLVSNSKRQIKIDMDQVNRYVSRWKPGTPIDVEVKRRIRKNSDPMRAFYFAAVLPKLCEAIGYDRHEHLLVHRQLKIVYFGVEPDKRGIYRNVPHVFNKSKSKLDVPKQVEFVEWVIRRAAENGAYIDDKIDDGQRVKPTTEE